MALRVPASRIIGGSLARRFKPLGLRQTGGRRGADQQKGAALWAAPELVLKTWIESLERRAGSVRNSRLRIRREGGVTGLTAEQVLRHFERLVVLLVRRHVRLR